MRISTLLLFVVATFVCPSIASAQSFDEITLGDFSDNFVTPTTLGLLGLGSNTITGTVSSFDDPDVVTFSVGANQQLTSFLITDFSGAGSHFFGLDDSNGLPVNPVPDDFLFAGILSDSQTPFEILGSFGGTVAGSGGIGVPSVLGPGEYTAFFNETSGVVTNYTAQLTVVSTVPEPSSAVLMIGSVGLMFLRRRRSS